MPKYWAKLFLAIYTDTLTGRYGLTTKASSLDFAPLPSALGARKSKQWNTFFTYVQTMLKNVE
jgi:hypothetical protein